MSRFEDLASKRVFISGAASGIGYEMALAFAAEGAEIVATDIQQDALAELSAQIEAKGGNCRTGVLDVTDDSAVTSFFSSLAAEGALPDVVINNAGIGFIGGFGDTDNEIWRRVLDINVCGVANGCRAFLNARGDDVNPALLVNIASAASIAPMPNMSAYAASKYAVEGLSEVLAMELAATAVDVACVHPGVINTPIVNHPELSRMPEEQLQRLQNHYVEHGAHPADVARAVIAGVRSGAGNIYAGGGLTITRQARRLLPRRWFRRLLMGKAQEIGYL